MADGTGKVDYNSDLVRKAWVTEGLVQEAAQSFWAPYKGKTLDSIIISQNDIAASAGKTVVFDFDGALSGKPVKGNTTAKGTGEQKKKFSDKLTVYDYRYVVDNGTKFDGVDIGDLSINEHSHSRGGLADLWVRSEDQSYFDLAQQGAEFGVDLGTTFTFDQLLDLENIVANGTGFDTYPGAISQRLPQKQFKLKDGRKVWLFLIDTAMKIKLMKSSGAQNLLKEADLRGNDNRLIRSQLGMIGPFLFLEAQRFFGETIGDILSDGYYNYDNTGVEASGMRQYDTVNDAWTGEEGFDVASTIKSRGVILGAGAFQKANGMMPNYELESTDFKKFSESCLEVWCAAKSTKLKAENADNKHGKIAGYNYGSMFVDVTV